MGGRKTAVEHGHHRPKLPTVCSLCGRIMYVSAVPCSSGSCDERQELARRLRMLEHLVGSLRSANRSVFHRSTYVTEKGLGVPLR